MNGMLRIPRSRGALSGVLLILLGAWGGLIPFIGPYFHYAYAPSSAWSYTSGRLWLEIVPAAGAVAGGLILLASASRLAALFGAWLAVVSGAWFAVGGLLGPIWRGHPLSAGTPVGGTITRSVEQIGFFTGLGLAVAVVAAVALGRLTVIAARDTRVASPATSGGPVSAAPAPAPGPPAGRHLPPAWPANPSPSPPARSPFTGSPPRLTATRGPGRPPLPYRRLDRCPAPSAPASDLAAQPRRSASGCAVPAAAGGGHRRSA